MTGTTLNMDINEGQESNRKPPKTRTRTVYFLFGVIAVLLVLVITFAVLYAKKDTSSDDAQGSSKSKVSGGAKISSNTGSQNPSSTAGPPTVTSTPTQAPPTVTSPPTQAPPTVTPRSTQAPPTVTHQSTQAPPTVTHQSTQAPPTVTHQSTQAPPTVTPTSSHSPSTTIDTSSIISNRVTPPPSQATPPTIDPDTLKDIADQTLSFMDVSADPCNDFHRFACGGLLDNYTISDTAYSNGSADIAVHSNEVLYKELLEASIKRNHSYEAKMKTLYKACMNEDVIDNNWQEVYTSKYSQDWPSLNPEWNSSTFDLQGVNNKYAGWLTEVLFASFVALDANRTEDRYTWNIYDPTLLLMKPDFLDEENSTKIEAFKKYYTDMAVALGAEQETAKKDANDAFEFQKGLAQHFIKAEDVESSTATRNLMSLEDMNQKYPYLNWASIFQSMFDNIHVTIKPEQVVNVNNPDYFLHLGDLFKQTSNRTIQNTFGFAQARRMIESSSRNLMALRFNFDKANLGVKKEQPRDKYCMGQLESVYNFGLAKMVADRRFPDSAKTFMKTLIENLKEAYVENINSTEWMNEATKEKAIKKVRGITFQVGVPDGDFEDSDLDEMYKDFKVDDSDHFTRDLYQNNRQLSILKLRKLNAMWNITMWSDETMTEVNAFNVPNQNELVFPLGILQPPYFDVKRPSAMNYGAIGLVIGHEIGHSFDNDGRQHDDKGRLINWWLPKDGEEYDKRAQCFINQYSNYTIPIGGKEYQADGNITIGENIADNIGLKASYKAYNLYLKSIKPPGASLPLPKTLNMNAKKLFFLSFAQDWCKKTRPEALKTSIKINNHSVGRLRIIGPLQNSEEFAQEYGCQPGDYMNPTHKCTLW